MSRSSHFAPFQSLPAAAFFTSSDLGDLDGCFRELGGDFYFTGQGFEEIRVKPFKDVTLGSTVETLEM